MVRKKTKTKIPSLPSPYFLGSTSHFCSQLLYLLLHRVAQRGLEWGLLSVHNSSALPLLPPYTVPHFQHGVPSHGMQFLQTSPTWVSLTWVSAGLFCTLFIPPPLSVRPFCCYLSLFSLRHHPLACRARLGPVLGWLYPGGTGHVWHRAAPASPQRGCPAAPAAMVTQGN